MFDAIAAEAVYRRQRIVEDFGQANAGRTDRRTRRTKPVVRPNRRDS